MKAEQLRKSILQLAIQGKLVPQDPNDEPASVLLERIRAEKQRLIKEGKIKKDKNDSVIFKGDDNRHYEKVGSEIKDITDDLPFEIPDSWAFVRLSTVCWLGDVAKSTGEKLPYLDAKTLRGKADKSYLTEGKVIDVGEKVILVDGENSGEVFDIPFRGYMGSTFKTLEKVSQLTFGYLNVVLDYYRDTFRGNKIGAAIPHLNKNLFKSLLIGIPPLAEQARIVAEIEKFEPLIAEYDKLEQQATKLDEEIYDKLKKSILQYAIQGKLVPQDPNDEPASVLLEHIRAEKKAKLGKKYVDSYIYKGDDNCYYEHIVGRVQDELVEVPFDIPKNWVWAKLLDLGCFSSGKTPDMSEPAYWQNGNVQWFTSKDMKTKYLTESQLKITELAVNDMTLYPANTLLWVVRSGILKSSLPICILKQPATINQDIKAYQLYQSSMIDYVYYMLKGMEARILDNYVKRITTVHSLKFDELISKLVVPIPPIAEQNRIVAKINEMFAMM